MGSVSTATVVLAAVPGAAQPLEELPVGDVQGTVEVIGARFGANHRAVVVHGQFHTVAELGPPGVLLLRSEEHTSELQSRGQLVCRLLPEKKQASATAHPVA